jgi:Uma2 family endonuclease
MATTKPKLMTADDLFAMPDRPGRVDLIRGELHEMPPAGIEHGEISAGLIARLWFFAQQHRLGKVYSSETGFFLFQDPDTVLGPDAAFVRTDREPPPSERRGYARLAPDLAVEVISPSERSGMIARKVSEYLEAGVRLLWLVEPQRHTVTVHRADRSVSVLHEPDTLDGEDVLPGFQLPVADVFR